MAWPIGSYSASKPKRYQAAPLLFRIAAKLIVWEEFYDDRFKRCFERPFETASPPRQPCNEVRIWQLQGGEICSHRKYNQRMTGC
jgi:hypothetical protein